MTPPPPPEQLRTSQGLGQKGGAGCPLGQGPSPDVEVHHCLSVATAHICTKQASLLPSGPSHPDHCVQLSFVCCTVSSIAAQGAEL
jgi:hypothetical protein